MSRYTSYRTGGNADILCTPGNTSELVEILRILRTEYVPVYVFGNCSNVLVRDKGIRGAVILMSGLKNINVNGTLITCEAGVSLARMANAAMNSGLTGAEPVSGIPGSVGGAVSMNAGSYGTEMKDIVVSVEYLDKDLNIVKKNNTELCFGNRRSCFTGTDDIVLNAVFSFRPGVKEEIKTRM
jgi:UDP-N-acetylmuramate dehydrogenase